ncbi:hypothetical protein PIB30_021737 [Stylosanthes scabra]|uniref:Transposase (Putative), gypsy type n=1 Tax=Stylosanthes scabra TaxID=79078 RepID=A0ABU6TAZ0_9FABA|nr:hypothetical protein [Stylosanthes scabra]
MGKKRSCRDLKVPRPLNAAETRPYGWVEEAVLTQPSVVESDSLPEFRRNFSLMEDAGPSDRKFFTHLRVRLPFSDFQRDVITCCRVAVSQLHLNGWGFILAFEKVCLHYGFRPTIRLFFYIYDVLIPSTGFRYISFRARQGRKLFDSYEDSNQEFKWHYFKVLLAPGRHAFWLDHEDKPFSWVYWNPEVKDFTVYNLEQLEMAAFKFLVSLPGGLPKRNKFTCRWILDSSDAEVGKFLDAKMKKTKLDNLLGMMADPSRMGPHAVLPTGRPAATAVAAAAAASASAAAPTPAESSSQVPPVPTAPETHQAKKQSSKRERAKVVNLDGEEGLKENPAADLQRKRQKKKKAKEDDAFDRVLGDDSAWKNEVDPFKVAFPENFNFLKALDAGLTSASLREALVKMPPEQLLSESYHFTAKSLACLQVGMETSLAAKVKAEKELSAALDQIEILKGERDLALAFCPLKRRLTILRISSLRRQGAKDPVGVLSTVFGRGEKQSAAAKKQAGSLAASLKTCQADLSKATEASEYWRAEWQKLGTEVIEMCHKTLDICLDQVSHLCPGVDFSTITLKSRWDLKGRRIYVPQESDVEEELPQAEVVMLEQRPEDTTQASQPAAGDVAGVSGECPT